MASKKQKKSKGKTISLQEFTASLESTTAGQNVIYAPKATPYKSWADEVDEDDYAVIADKEKIILPSAPRASRGPDFDETSIPSHGPFVAHVGNIAFDIDEGDLYAFFKDQEVVELRLPKDLNNRLRGFGYIHFRTRDQLIEALCLNEQMLSGRPLRINLGQGQEGGDRRGGGGRGNVDQTPDDWRSAPTTELDPPRPSDHHDFRSDRGGRSDNYGSDFGRSEYGSRSGGGEYGRRPYGGGRNDFNDGGSSDFGGFRGERSDYGARRGGDFGDRDGGRNYGGGGGRDFDRSDFGSRRGGGFGGRRDEPVGGESEEEGTWRRNPVPRADPPQEERRYRNQDREGDNRDRRYGSRDRELSPDFSDARSRQPRTQSPEFIRPPQRPQAPAATRMHDEEEREPRKPSPPRERKKLVIAPRTVTTTQSSEPAVTSSIFGGARPVDTAAREREIEMKLAEQNEEPRRIRILQRPKPEVENETPRSRSGTSSSTVSNERLASPQPQTPLPVLPVRGVATETETKPNVKPSDASTQKSESDPSPAAPATNAWARRQENRISREAPGQTTLVSHNNYDEDEGHEHDERSMSRDDQHSPHPDSDHKDTNSEPEDERDLRLQQEEADDFQRVERRGRKPKPSPIQEQNYRPPASRGETNRGSSGGYGGGRGGNNGPRSGGSGGGLRRGN